MRLSLLIKISLLAALSAVLMSFSLPIFPSHSYLRYDPSEVPALIASFALGPAAGMAVVLLKNLIHGLTHFQPTELVGLPINSLAGCALVGVAGTVYRVRKSKSIALLSLGLGVLAMTLVMIPCNLVLLPLFQRIFFPTVTPSHPDEVMAILLSAIIPFNMIKGSLTSILTFLVYKRVSPILKSVPRWDVGLSAVRKP